MKLGKCLYLEMTDHASVLLEPFLRLAAEVRPRTFWDGTLGLGGHAIALARLLPELRVWGSDADIEMLNRAGAAIASAGLSERFSLAQGNFASDPHGSHAPFDIILLDLGISSLHIDELDRGITFRGDQELDMRLDVSQGEPVWRWLNKAKTEEIMSVLFRYGEESFAPHIARAIVARRETFGELRRNFELREICEEVYRRRVPAAKRHTFRYPAVKTFQALRIFINQELASLEKALEFLPERLNVGGRLFIISFHSLEDRLVKHAFAERTRIIETDPLARRNYREGDYTLVVKKSIVPDKNEIAKNSRARSARMRVLQRLR